MGKRQAPQSDFVNRILSMFNFSADGGPGQMMTGLFTMLLNQTSSIFGPLVGTTGGDGMNFFNQIAQQFMSVFGQMSGLWSNRVARQMASWRNSIPERDMPEYELVRTSSSRLSEVGSRLQQIQKMSLVPEMVRQVSEMRQAMNNVWQCVGGEPRSQMPLKVTAMTDAQVVSNAKQMVVQMQEELVILWRLLSEQIVADISHANSAPGCKSVAECMANPSSTVSPDSTSLPASTETIEFEEMKN